MSFQRAQLAYDLAEPRYDPVREKHRDRIAALLCELNGEVEALCELDGVSCDRVSVNEFFCMAVGFVV